MSSETRIVVVRKKGWRDKLRAYAVLIDGRKVGKIREGKTEAFSVEPGAHDVCVKIDWCSSPTVSVDIAEGESVRLLCKAGGSAWRARRDAFSNAGGYIALELRDREE